MKIAIIDFFELSLIQNLQIHDFGFDYLPDSSPEFLRNGHDANVLILKSKVSINAQFLNQWKNLQYVIRAGAGIDHIDVDELQKRNITLITTNEGNRNAVAEHALGLLLALMNNIVIANQQVKKFQWIREANRGHEIEGKTVGIIGFGNTGSAFAEKFKGFQAKVIAYDKYKTGFSNDFVKEVSLETIQNESDILSLHVPLTNETHHMVNKDFLAKFQKPFWLLNLSRGSVIKTEDLLPFLHSKKILGAGIDVLENENFSTYSESEKKIAKLLFANENVILTPHIGGWSFESSQKINQIILQKLIELRS